MISNCNWKCVLTIHSCKGTRNVLMTSGCHSHNRCLVGMKTLCGLARFDRFLTLAQVSLDCDRLCPPERKCHTVVFTNKPDNYPQPPASAHNRLGCSIMKWVWETYVWRLRNNINVIPSKSLSWHAIDYVCFLVSKRKRFVPFSWSSLMMIVTFKCASLLSTVLTSFLLPGSVLWI